jgi:hypothetical protein
MHLRLLGITYDDTEVERFIQLRSMEWEAFPVFATRAFAPLAMFWIPWWQLILILLVASAIWCPVRNHIASPELAAFGGYIGMVMVALPVNVIIAIIFFSQAKILEGCLALVWNLVATLLAFAYPPSRSSALQEKLWSRVQGVAADEV